MQGKSRQEKAFVLKKVLIVFFFTVWLPKNQINLSTKYVGYHYLPPKYVDCSWLIKRINAEKKDYFS